MAIKIALILSVVLQFGAAIIALSLIRRTRTNIAWWLISFAFLLMAFRRLFEIQQVFEISLNVSLNLINTWISVFISVLMLVSLAFVRRIFNLQRQFDELRKKNESRVLSAIIRTEESERQHFSKELHDGLGPLLSSVKMAISATRNKIDKNDKIIINAEKLIDESVSSLKEISNKLSPHILNNMGLHKAVKSFINSINPIHKISFHYKSNLDGKRYNYNVEVVLYRVLCELISNTLKHAGANNIYIDLLESDEEIITLKYIDDGSGFELHETSLPQNGMGFSNMQSRIRSINGGYDVFSRPGEGIRVSIIINIAKQDGANYNNFG
jgi:signal transduction histidine kinase